MRLVPCNTDAETESEDEVLHRPVSSGSSIILISSSEDENASDNCNRPTLTPFPPNLPKSTPNRNTSRDVSIDDMHMLSELLSASSVSDIDDEADGTLIAEPSTSKAPPLKQSLRLKRPAKMRSDRVCAPKGFVQAQADSSKGKRGARPKVPASDPYMQRARSTGLMMMISCGVNIREILKSDKCVKLITIVSVCLD